MASMASKFTFDLKIEITSLNYLGIHVHVASNSHFGGLWGPDGLQKTSGVKPDLKIDLIYVCCRVSLACKDDWDKQQTANYDP